MLLPCLEMRKALVLEHVLVMMNPFYTLRAIPSFLLRHFSRRLVAACPCYGIHQRAQSAANLATLPSL
jgi:hypothetical protein